MADKTGIAVPGVMSASVASSIAMGQASLAGAASIGAIMTNAAVAEQACQQIELSVVGVVSAMIIAKAVFPAP